jgi:hypothetical protein
MSSYSWSSLRNRYYSRDAFIGYLFKTKNFLSHNFSLNFLFGNIGTNYSLLYSSFRSPSLFYLLFHSRCRSCLFSLDHTPQSVGLLCMRDQPVAETSTWQHKHSQETNVHTPGGILTHDPSKRSAADPRLIPRGHSTCVGQNLYVTNVSSSLNIPKPGISVSTVSSAGLNCLWVGISLSGWGVWPHFLFSIMCGPRGCVGPSINPRHKLVAVGCRALYHPTVNLPGRKTCHFPWPNA